MRQARRSYQERLNARMETYRKTRHYVRKLVPQPEPTYADNRMVKTVYIMRDGDRFKVGIADDPRKRMVGVRMYCPNVVLWATMPGGYKLEQMLHERLAKWRLDGEWFSTKAIPTLLAYVRKAKGTLEEAGLLSLTPAKSLYPLDWWRKHETHRASA